MTLFGEGLKEKREEKGLNQGELGDKAGVSQSYVSQIEKGEKIPSIDALKSFAKVLKIPEGDLINEAMSEQAQLIRAIKGLTPKKVVAVLKFVESL